MKLSFVDETTAGTRSPVFEITINTDTITVRQIIEIRIREEVLRKKFDGLVKPSWYQGKLQNKNPDIEQQINVACRAFEENRLLVLLRERQARSLDEELPLGEGDEVTFLRLIPLVGG